MLTRLLAPKVETALQEQAAVAILGPRQVGKTTLARSLAAQRDAVYLDLESPTDLAKLQDPLAYLTQQQGKLVIMDEIQRLPNIFQVLRVLIDQGRQAGTPNGQYLLLGSASLELLRQSAESLAGRIRYLHMTGVTLLELDEQSVTRRDQLWLRGGFPDSLLATSDAASSAWREDFIRTYLERDIPQLGPRMPATMLRRFWTMVAHAQGGNINLSQLASSLDSSTPTMSRYLDLLVDLLLVRKLQPWFSNAGKRLVKSPKVYVRDSGLVHHLLGVGTLDGLLGHPVAGPSWEGFVVENILAAAPDTLRPYYYRSSGGAEIDLVLEHADGTLWAIEIKRSSAPAVTKGFYVACEDLQPQRKIVVHGGAESFPLPHGVEAMPLQEIMRAVQSLR